MSESINISVCIATFERPQGLRRLLESLTAFAVLPEPRIEIVVVDNSARATARATVDSMQSCLPRLRYFVEPVQNISHARNRAVTEASGDWVAFIDDDEVAGAGWLLAYWESARAGTADGYFGPVLPRLEERPPPWLRPEIFLTLSRPAHGVALGYEHMRTTNALIRRALFATQRFDPAYGITGGGDYELFGRMLDDGAVFRWCDGAESFEYYGANRLSLRWLLQRAFRGGNTYTIVDRRRHPRWTHQMTQLAKALAGVLVYSLLVPFALLRGRSRAVVSLQRLCVQLGHLWAFSGQRYEEYRRASTR